MAAARKAPPPLVLEPLPAWHEYPPAEMAARARAFHADIARRRSVRDFSAREVPREVIEHCLLAAGTAPSGANQQPWFFSVITDPDKPFLEAAPMLIAIFRRNTACTWMANVSASATCPNRWASLRAF